MRPRRGVAEGTAPVTRTLLDKWRLLQAALTDPSLSPGAAILLGRMLSYLNLKGDREHTCYPSYDRLSQDLGCSRRQVMRKADELERQGWLTIDRRSYGETRAFASNSFRFVFDRALAVPEGEEVVTPMSLGGDADVARVVTPLSPGVVTPVSPYKGNIEQGNITPPAGEAGKGLRSTPESNLFGDLSQASRKPKGPSSDEVEHALALLKANYPKRESPRWSVVRDRVLPTILRSGVTGETLARKAGEYRLQCERTRKDPQFILLPQTWLNQKGWEDDYSPVQETKADAGSPSLTDEQWGALLREFDTDGSWPPVLGPEPGAAGCRVPTHILHSHSRKKAAAA
jgi:hypothetical protein